MPNVKTHDKLIDIFLPLVVLIFYIIGRNIPVRIENYLIIVIVFYLWGGYYFSPDLDVKSRIYYRWKWLRWIWIPYQKLVPHRGILSHGIIIGTFARVFYLFTMFSIIFLLVVYFLIKEFIFTIYIKEVINYIIANKYYIFSIFLALDLSTNVHTISDKVVTKFKRFIRKLKKKLKKLLSL